MKRQTNTHILLFLFLALVGALGYQKITEKSRAREILFEKKIVNFDDISKVNNIEIRRNGDSTSFHKENETWKSGKYPLIPFHIQELLKDIQEAAVMSVASSDLGNLENFGLQKERAQEFILRDGDKVLGSFTAGLKDPNIYIIKEKQRKVFFVANFAPYLLDSPWISMLADSFPKESIKKITIKENGIITLIAKDKDIWKVNGKIANKDTIDDMLNHFSKITAVAIPKEDEDFQDYDTTIDVELSSGSMSHIEIGKRESDGYMIKSSQGLLFILDDDTRNKIVPTEKYLILLR